MKLSTEQWHQRFMEQSKWTAPLRAFLFSQAHIENSRHILEVGCGTGAVTQDCSKYIEVKTTGIDISLDRVIYAQKHDLSSRFNCADVLSLPFSSQQFDIVFCHYFFLWLADRGSQALHEMSRVTRAGGVILALAEPDYQARIDYPPVLAQLGKLQTQSLMDQGAIPDMGRRLPELFSNAGLIDIRFGQSGFQNNVSNPPSWLESEWVTYQSDLSGCLSQQEIEGYKILDAAAWNAGKRVLLIPTFYAIGVVP
jgi:SAM-dependent methyltransferase